MRCLEHFALRQCFNWAPCTFESIWRKLYVSLWNWIYISWMRMIFTSKQPKQCLPSDCIVTAHRKQATSILPHACTLFKYFSLGQPSCTAYKNINKQSSNDVDRYCFINRRGPAGNPPIYVYWYIVLISDWMLDGVKWNRGKYKMWKNWWKHQRRHWRWRVTRPPLGVLYTLCSLNSRLLFAWPGCSRAQLLLVNN